MLILQKSALLGRRAGSQGVWGLISGWQAQIFSTVSLHFKPLLITILKQDMSAIIITNNLLKNLKITTQWQKHPCIMCTNFPNGFLALSLPVDDNTQTRSASHTISYLNTQWQKHLCMTWTNFPTVSSACYSLWRAVGEITPIYGLTREEPFWRSNIT